MNPELVEKRHAVAADNKKIKLINQADKLAKKIESIDNQIERLTNSINKTHKVQEDIQRLEIETREKTKELKDFLKINNIRLNDERLNRIITGQ